MAFVKLLACLFLCFQYVCAMNPVLPDNVCEVYYKPGDLVIGGMVPLYTGGNPCGEALLWQVVEVVEMFAYAVESINNRTDVLPNIKLGFEIRNDCGNKDIALWTAMTLLSTIGTQEFEAVCGQQSRLNTKAIVGIVGPSRTATSSVAARVGRLFRVPVISFAATSDELSNPADFPYFLRTVPSDNFQAGAILDLLLYFNWKYITLLYSADTYGIRGAHQLQLLAEKRGICIGLTLPLPGFASEDNLIDLANALNSPKIAKVIVLVSIKETAESLLKAVDKVKFDERITWVGSDGWGSSIARSDVNHVVHGCIFVQLYSEKVPEFHAYFKNLYYNRSLTKNPWYDTYIEKWKESTLKLNKTDKSGIPSFPVPTLDFETVAINAVYAFAFALHDFIKHHCGGHLPCKQLNPIDGEEFLSFLLNVTFQGASGDNFHFDENGDTGGIYKFRNLQFIDGTYQLVDVGMWDPSNKSYPFWIQENSIQWGHERTNPGNSTCREVCLPGYIPVPLERKCCWGCRKCPDNAIAINNTECSACPDLQWPDSDFRACIRLVPQGLSYCHPTVILLIIFACIGMVMTILAVCGLLRYLDHPLMKASSRELSVLNLLGVFLAIITHIPLLLPPTTDSCAAAEVMLTTSFTLTYAPTLLKVNRIFRIFNAGKKSARRPRCVGPRDQVFIISVIVVIQILAACCSASINPSKPNYMFTSPRRDNIELYCTLGTGFLISVGYNGIIIVACCFYAFKARKVPSNYNESKFIAASVYSTVVVCVSLIPVYTTAVGAVQKVSALCAALLLTAYITLVCLYLPKLYAIHFVNNDGDLQIQNWRTSSTRVGLEMRPQSMQNQSMLNVKGVPVTQT
ncbi:metabotropic glutamate receptor 5-like [Amphiura filiformis]|uniref:metabotropic glutamate receptor 5-like n=1 Tax=Amphiura filiformis TaxID=82378 RepID=UPI003B21D798